MFRQTNKRDEKILKEALYSSGKVKSGMKLFKELQADEKKEQERQAVIELLHSQQNNSSTNEIELTVFKITK